MVKICRYCGKEISKLEKERVVHRTCWKDYRKNYIDNYSKLESTIKRKKEYEKLPRVKNRRKEYSIKKEVKEKRKIRAREKRKDINYKRKSLETKRKFQDKHREELKEKLREYHKTERAKILRDINKKKQENKIKAKARKIANNIKIPIGKICEECKINLATERHHEDYNKPKEINFLCKECHAKKRRINI